MSARVKLWMLARMVRDGVWIVSHRHSWIVSPTALGWSQVVCRTCGRIDVRRVP